jgi:hypothetical protein
MDAYGNLDRSTSHVEFPERSMTEGWNERSILKVEISVSFRRSTTYFENLYYTNQSSIQKDLDWSLIRKLTPKSCPSKSLSKLKFFKGPYEWFLERLLDKFWFQLLVGQVVLTFRRSLTERPVVQKLLWKWRILPPIEDLSSQSWTDDLKVETSLLDW